MVAYLHRERSCRKLDDFALCECAETSYITEGNMKRLVRLAIAAYAIIIGACALNACSFGLFEGTKKPGGLFETPDVDLSNFITTPGNAKTPSPTASQSPESTDAFGSASPDPNTVVNPNATSYPGTMVYPGVTDDPGSTPPSSHRPDNTHSPMVTDLPESPNNTTPLEERVVYMTFDDGPCKLTYQLLDILDRYNVKATFFTVGYFVDRYPEIVREAESRGHLIACHTYSHDYDTIYESAQAFMDDVHRWEEAVERALGHLPQQVVVRFPGGSKMSGLSDEIRQEIFAALKQGGYKWYNWNCGNNDAWPAGNVNNLPTEEYLLQSSLLTIKWAFDSSKPFIFLAHDTNEDTINMIHLVIEELISRGSIFHTLVDCP